LADEDVADYVSSNLRAYMSIPGTRLVRVVPGYFPDPASADFGVLLEWPNPIPRLLRHVAPIKSYVVRKIREGINQEWEQRKQHLRDLAARRARERVPGYLRRSADEQGPPGAPEELEAATREKTIPRT
ncbi:MAG: hypothetical protein IIB19_00920, partial [Chloroflexi bacterium]|nr:hypothetical protein [Chloroflexota bacterium]